MKKNSYIFRFLSHLHTVNTHRRWVRYFCFKGGLYWQGLVHDLSKYSPTEFLESVVYYDGTRSPIDVCKEQNDYSLAWYHHRGRNKHHYEYWYDRFDEGGYAPKMPFKYVLEMICDYLAAGVTYSGGIKQFSMCNELNWWRNKCKIAAMHLHTKLLISKIFRDFYRYGILRCLESKEYRNSLQLLYTSRLPQLERILEKSFLNRKIDTLLHDYAMYYSNYTPQDYMNTTVLKNN